MNDYLVTCEHNAFPHLVGSCSPACLNPHGPVAPAPAASQVSAFAALVDAVREEGRELGMAQAKGHALLFKDSRPALLAAHRAVEAERDRARRHELAFSRMYDSMQKERDEARAAIAAATRRAEAAERFVKDAELAYVGSEVMTDVLVFFEAAGCGRPGTPNTLWSMTQEIIAREAASRAEAEELRRRLGPVPERRAVLRYVSWGDAQDIHALAQPLVDHVEAGKLAKRVCDFLTPGAVLDLVAPAAPDDDAPVCDPEPRCGECGSPMELRLSRYGRFWGCVRFPTCRGTHGAHQSTGAPLGVPADKATREARVMAHASLDALWKKGLMSRRAAYRWLQEAMGLSVEEAHIGKFTTEQCNRLIELARGRQPRVAPLKPKKS